MLLMTSPADLILPDATFSFAKIFMDAKSTPVRLSGPVPCRMRDGFPDKPFSPGGGLFCPGYSAKTARLTNNFSRISIG